MADVNFRFTAVPNRYQDVVQRMATLYPIRQPATRIADVLTDTQAVVQQWRARLGLLWDCGWLQELPAARQAMTYMRNCRPTFAMPDRDTRTCRRAMICPFCHARWVRDVWRVIDADFPAPDTVEPTEREELEFGRELRSILLDVGTQEDARASPRTFRWHLVERHRYNYYPVDLVPDSAGDGLAHMLRIFENQRSLLVRHIDPVGAFFYTTVEPYDSGRQWRVHHRQLFKLAPEQRFTAPAGGQVTRHVQPTRRTVLGAVARACRYPIGLLTGDPDMTVLLLQARQAVGFRSHSRFRSFRKRTTRES